MIRIVSADKPQETLAKFTFEQDGEELNILCNGSLIAYFSLKGEKISLSIVGLVSELRDLFNVSGNGEVEIR